jgi:hypothetical protein
VSALAALLVSLGLGLAAQDRPAVYHPSDVRQMQVLASVLKRRVAYFELKLRMQKKGELLDPTRDGYGAVLSAHRIVAPSFLFEDVETITVVGPRGRTTGKVVLSAPELRIALIDTVTSLEKIGLEASAPAPAESRALDKFAFALVSTTPDGDVLVGTVTDDGSAPELEGHVRTTLRLSAGMPVFDESARLLGYARTAVWDHEKTLLVTPAQIEAARTATRAVGKPAAPPAPPWWTGPKEPRFRDAGTAGP